MSEDATTTQDLKRRVGLACGAMQNLNPVWKAKEIRVNTKLRVYDALVLSLLLYTPKHGRSEKQTTTDLQVFEMNCLTRSRE